ncbi:hypothetical protein [Thiocystis minor]|uniref:hypothetical protein n=1 Tax=Thiocystis minor TaxID=61597 RepID=UPI0030B8788F
MLDPPPPSPALQRAAKAHRRADPRLRVPRFRIENLSSVHNRTGFQSGVDWRLRRLPTRCRWTTWRTSGAACHGLGLTRFNCPRR